LDVRLISSNATIGQGVAQPYATNGDVGAMVGIAFLYYHGLGVAQDYARARQRYDKAADKGA
jgi:TPR repeat protein